MLMNGTGPRAVMPEPDPYIAVSAVLDNLEASVIAAIQLHSVFQHPEGCSLTVAWASS